MSFSAEPRDVRFQVRATRAAPPGHAAEDARRGTYGAALAQFEELLAAAGTASPASRPLPLFYALSQAGRATAAAFCRTAWRVRGHGLSAPDLDGDLRAVVVRRAAGARTGFTDSFSGISEATGSPAFTSAASLEELWAALPEVAPFLPDPKAPTPLRLIPDTPEGVLVPWGRVLASIQGYAGNPETLVQHLETHFPSTIGVQLSQPQGAIPHVYNKLPSGDLGLRVYWRAEEETVASHLATLDRVAPDGVGFLERWLRPAVGGTSLSPLLTWWPLLFGLSMLARYEPGGWASALDVDSSPLAAPLERVLEIALDRIPELVLAALITPTLEHDS